MGDHPERPPKDNEWDCGVSKSESNDQARRKTVAKGDNPVCCSWGIISESVDEVLNQKP